jgi:NADPH:quinone reductase-like Zn-dependent oxidoreductase
MTPAIATRATTAATMKAVVQEGSGSAMKALQFREIPIPAITEDQVLVRVVATSVNAADYHAMHGGWLVSVVGKVMRAPKTTVAGSDASGYVEAVGANVKTLRPGDAVFGVARGALAQYAVGSERGLVAKPARLSFAQAGAIGIAGVTALQAVRDHGNVKPGDRVLIYGAGGGVGTFAVQIAKSLGAHVTAVTGPRTAELVRGLGPDEVVDYTKEDVLKHPARYDAVIDIAATRPLGQLRGALKPERTLVMVGASKSGGMGAILMRILAQVIRKKVFGQRIVMFIAKTRRDDYEFLRALIEAGKVTPVVEREYPLAEAREAYDYAGSGQARAKVVINVG